MGMNCWIFQSTVDRFDLRDPGQFQVGKRDSWAATRYRAEMHPEDLVFFWLAGPSDIRGIYGWGKLTSSPYLMGKEGYVVDVQYLDRLSEPILVGEIEQSSDLEKLQIIRISIGTNFRIDRKEADAIAELIGDRGTRPEIRP